MLKNFLIFLLIISVPAHAQVTQRNLLAKQFTLADFQSSVIPLQKWNPYPKTALEWKNAIPDSTILSLIKAGETALQKEIPQLSGTILMNFVRTGDREEHGKISFARRVNLTDLILAESVEDKNRFTEAIMNYIWTICEETFWGVPAHLSVQKARNGLPDSEDPIVDLFAAETASVLALADYFTGEKLDKISPLIRKRIYSETNRRIFEPIKQADRYAYLSKTKAVNNWNPWIVSNLLMADLFLEKDEKIRKEYAYTYMTHLDAYLNGLGEDGGCDEGPSYWFAAGACVFDALETLESATGGKVNIYKEPLIKKMASYVYKMHIANDYFVNFADADPKLRPDGLMLYRFGKQLKDEDLSQFGIWAFNRFPTTSTSNNSFHRQRKIQNILTLKNIPAAKSSYKPVANAWFNDIEVLTTRTSNGLFLATHGGHNAESHNHNDVGDFIIYANGEPVIVDAGRGNYTAKTFSSKRYELWFTQSQYHNLPIINGLGQLAGREYTARNVKSTINTKENSLAMDLASAYAKEAGILSWNRLVKVDELKNAISITDDYALNADPKSLQQIFMTVCEVNMHTPGKILFITPGQKVVNLTYDAKLWTATSDMPSTEGMEYRSFKTKWDNHPVQRIILTSKSPQKKGKYSFAFVKAN